MASPRRHDLDRRARAGQDADLAARSAASSAAGYLAEQLGTENVVCTDIGGTSFDLALITDGHYHIKNIPDIGRFLLNIPLVQIDSVGAGTGSLRAGQPVLGPDRDRPGLRRLADRHLRAVAASRPRRSPTATSSWATSTPTTSSAARCSSTSSALARAIARAGRRAARAERRGRGRGRRAAVRGPPAELGRRPDPRQGLLARSNYTLMCYGGGGPLHVAGYTRGVHFEDVLVPAWAAGFSAFGCACADFEYRFDRTGRPAAAARRRRDAEQARWRGAADRRPGARSRSRSRRVRASPATRATTSPSRRWCGCSTSASSTTWSCARRWPGSTPEDDVEALIEAFEELLHADLRALRPHARARLPVHQAIVKGSVAVEKPTLPADPETPESGRRRSRRRAPGLVATTAG